MPAEIITIGTELLLGEIADTNSAYLASGLRGLGIDLYRTTTVGDNVQRIAAAVRESLARADVVITTGGLGPTVDDVTREGVAAALGVGTVFLPELWDQIKERFARFGVEPGENNRRQATLPAGSRAIENPVGTAPGFILEAGDSVVITLPGVPAEMKHLFETVVSPYLRRKFDTAGVIVSRLVRTAGVGESWLDERIGDLEKLSNPTVGVSAHPGRVDIRITAKADTEAETEIRIAEVEARVRRRLGAAVYGVGDQTLEGVVSDMLAALGWRLTSVEAGTGGRLAGALSPTAAYLGGQVLPGTPGKEPLQEALAAEMAARSAEAGLALAVTSGARKHALSLQLVTPLAEEEVERTYGGPAVNAPAWGVSLALDGLRRLLSRDE